MATLNCNSAEIRLRRRSFPLSNIEASLLDEANREKLARYAAIVEDGVGFRINGLAPHASTLIRNGAFWHAVSAYVAFAAPIGIFRAVKVTLGLFFAVALGTLEAAACLGQHESRVPNEAKALSGKFVRAERKGYTEVRIEREDGTVVKQYVNGKGLVFGITWQAPRMPDLKPLLGTYFGEFQEAVRARGHHSGAFVTQTAHLVIESMGHMRAFHGRIYVPGLLPANVTREVIQ